MKLESEQFDEVADKIAGVRGDFLTKGDFTARTRQEMEEKVAEILRQNSITDAEFSQGLEDRVFPQEALRRQAEVSKKHETNWNWFFNVQG